MNPEHFRMLDLADDCLVPILRYLLAREGGSVEGPFGTRQDLYRIDDRSVDGLAASIQDYRQMRGGNEQERIKASAHRGKIDAYWSAVRSHGLEALRSQADARYPND